MFKIGVSSDITKLNNYTSQNDFKASLEVYKDPMKCECGGTYKHLDTIHGSTFKICDLFKCDKVIILKDLEEEI